MADWQEQFDSPLLFLLGCGAMLTVFGSFLFGQILGTANSGYVVLLIVFVVFGFVLYDKIGGGLDLSEDVEIGPELKGVGIGLGLVILFSTVISGVVGAPTASIWVPKTLVPLSANPAQIGGLGSAQWLLDVMVLLFFVAPAERALVAIGAAVTLVSGLGDELPLWQQPMMHGTTILWAVLHVAFGQYPWWFFFVVYPSGIAMLFAADLAGDYSAAVGVHGIFDATVRTLRFLATGV